MYKAIGFECRSCSLQANLIRQDAALFADDTIYVNQFRSDCFASLLLCGNVAMR